MAKTSKKSVSFEEKLHRIEALVSQLEQQSLALDQAISCYEEGVHLVKECQKILAEAEQKVTVLREGKHES